MNDVARQAPPRILVIDDNPAIHEDFRKIFDASRDRPAPSAAELVLFGHGTGFIGVPGYRIDSAHQGQEGLAFVQRAQEQHNPYALAFVDVRMPPGWDGVETVAQIWRCDPDIQVVICTAYSDYSWSEMLAKLGRSDRLVILKKPFDTIEVVQLAIALTEKWRLARLAHSTREALESMVVERTCELAQAMEHLAASEAQYRLLFDSNPHPMWVYDLETLRFVAVNGAAVEHYGYSAAEFLAMTIRDIRPQDERAALDERLRAMPAHGKSFGAWRHCQRDGALIDVEVSSDYIVFDGRPARLVLAHDVTARKQAEDRIKRLNRVHTVMSGINTLIVRVRDRDDLFKEACRIAIEAGGFQMAMIAMVGPDPMGIVPAAAAGMDAALLGVVTELLSSSERVAETMVARAVGGKKVIVSNDVLNDPAVVMASTHAERGVHSIAVLPLIVADRAVGAFALYAGEANFFHADELKLLTELADDVAFGIDHIEKQERLDYLAYYDALTGLANRKLFLDRVAQHLRGVADGGPCLMLCLIDLERFRNINDSLGRPAGDTLLRQVAEWLTRNLGGANLVARLGADQFAVVLPALKQAGDAVRLIEKTMAAFVEHPFRLNDAVFRIAARVGAAVFPDDGADADVLFMHAEAALKKAKATGERYMLYAPNMTAMMAPLTLETQLRQALDHQEFVLHYQPKVDFVSGKTTGAEALIRWNDPRTGLVPPGRFIPVLEETGLILAVGRWALREAVAESSRWRAAGLPAVRIAVNVSPRQLRNRGFIGEVQHAIGVDAAAAAGLELEVTETLLMEDLKHSIASLQALRAMGVSIAIDDFGTGFSSLSYLSRLPVDTLKIDRSFIVDMTITPQGLSLVSTIINLAHSLKLKVVAEGVETEEQSRLLRLLSCDEMQGYLFSEAVPAEIFRARFLGAGLAADQ